MARTSHPPSTHLSLPHPFYYFTPHFSQPISSFFPLLSFFLLFLEISLSSFLLCWVISCHTPWHDYFDTSVIFFDPSPLPAANMTGKGKTFPWWYQPNPILMANGKASWDRHKGGWQTAERSLSLVKQAAEIYLSTTYIYTTTSGKLKESTVFCGL